MSVVHAAIFLMQAANTPEERGFPWTIHAITIPAMILIGVVIGWLLRERKLAEDSAREEIDGKPPGKSS